MSRDGQVFYCIGLSACRATDGDCPFLLTHVGQSSIVVHMGHAQVVAEPWTLGWRMRWAAESAGISYGALADEFGYDRKTLSRWTHDEQEPRPVILKQWAAACGVREEWLKNGTGLPRGPQPKARGNRNRTQSARAREQHTHPEVTPARLPVAA